MKNYFALVMILLSSYHFYAQNLTTEEDSIQERFTDCFVSYDTWLGANCDNTFEVYNGDLGKPIPSSLIPYPGGGNVWHSCAWANLGASSVYMGAEHASSPDLYMPNNTNYDNPGGTFATRLGVPMNLAGYQNDHTPISPANSTGYMGLYTYHPEFEVDGDPSQAHPEYREYIMNNFPFQLSAGVTYTITFWVSLADMSAKATNIQAWVGREQSIPNLAPNFYDNVVFPGTSAPNSIRKYSSGIINSAGTWIPNTFTFTPQHTANYFIVFGNFENNVSTPIANNFATNPSIYTDPEHGKVNRCYFYIDDISITGVDPNPCCVADYQFLDDYLIENVPNNDINWSMSGNPTTITNSVIYVNGLLHVDVPVILDNCTLNFSPLSSLIVDPGKSIDIKNSVLQGCPEMWQGISSNDPNSSIKMKNSWVLDALQAIDCKNNVKLDLKSNIFRNNYNGIKLSNYPGTWSTFVYTGNRIRCISNLKAPLTAFRSNNGIEISNVGNVNLSQSGGSNWYHELQQAILLNNCNSNVSNQKINVGTSGSPTNNPFTYGILANSTDGQMHYVNIANYNGPTIVKNVFNGIRFFGKYYCIAEKCQVENIVNAAIIFENISPQPLFDDYQIKCRQNTINNSRVGIGLYEIYHTRADVSRNQMTNQNHVPKSIGIDYDNIFPQSQKCANVFPLNNLKFIDENWVNRYEIGINTEQCNCTAITENQINMRNNFSFYTQYHGIWAKENTSGEIGLNNVNGTAPFLLPNNTRNIGIRLFENSNEVIYCNTVDSNGFGLWLEGGGSLTTFLVKNSISNYERGMYFTGGLQLQNQLQYPSSSTALSHRNEWINKNSNPGSIPEIYTEAGLNMGGTHFYFFSADPNSNSSNSNVNNISGGPGAVIPPLDLISDPTIPLCDDVFATPSGPNGRVLSFFMDSTNTHWDSSSVYGLQAKWLSQREIARVYQAYEDTLSLCTLPVAVNNYINDIHTNTTCLNTIMVNKYVSENDYVNALIANGGINGSCSSGSVYKDFNSIAIPYIQAYRNYDTIVVDSDDVGNILYIANLCPYQFGEVVSAARTFAHTFINDTLTFINPCEVGNEEPRSFEMDRGEEIFFTIKVFPNPTSKNISIASLWEENFQYEIFDMIGKKLMQGNFIKETTLDIGALSDGNYVLIIQSNERIEKFKIIVKK